MSELNGSEKPSTKIQRQLMEDARERLRAEGFSAELVVATIKVQKSDDREKVKTLDEYRTKAENCYASAKEITRLLGLLPEDPKEGEAQT